MEDEELDQGEGMEMQDCFKHSKQPVQKSWGRSAHSAFNDLESGVSGVMRKGESKQQRKLEQEAGATLSILGNNLKAMKEFLEGEGSD